MDGAIHLRTIAPGDGPALDRLNRETPDIGAIAFFTEFKHDPYETMMALHHGLVGVVAEAEGYDGLVGMGLVSFGECQYEGALVPYAYFSSLSVHPDYRRRGIAGRLGLWRMETAQKWFDDAGRAGVIFAGIQGGNTGSLQTALKWSNQRIDNRSRAAIVKMRSKPPRNLSGLTVGRADDSEFGEIADKQNRFYANYNLYVPGSGQDLKDWRATKVFGHSINDYYVAVDKAGKVRAGMAVVTRGDLQVDHVVRLPALLKFANIFLQVLPPGGAARRVSAKQIWAEDEDKVIGAYLWESVRWLMRYRGTNLMTFFDPASAVAHMVTLPRFAPKSMGSIVLLAGKRASPARPLYFQA